MLIRPSGHRASFVAAVVGVFAVVGCGGSGGDGAERARLVKALSAQTSSFPSDLSSCVEGKAKALPIDQLRSLAASHPDPAAKRSALQIVTSCVQEGKGVAALRTQIVQQVTTSLPTSLPAAFRTCVQDKAGSISAGTLAQILSAYSTSGAAGVRSKGELVGRQLAAQCVGEPAVLAGLRAQFVKPIEKLANNSHYSAAFRQCFLHKIQQIPAGRLEQFVLHPETASVAGRALGAAYAHQCINQGARP